MIGESQFKRKGIFMNHSMKILQTFIIASLLLITVRVGSEEARLRASLRPPPKLHVRFSRMQLSRRHVT